MHACDLLAHLRELGMEVSVDGNTLRCGQARGIMTDHLREQIRANRDELIRLLAAETPANIEPPAYVKKCEVCSGTNWGCVHAEIETLKDGTEHELET